MAFTRPDRVRETSSSSGTGDITLSGAPTGWRTFASQLSTGDTFPYVVEGRDANGAQTAEWETGIGTWSATGKLQRTLVTASSNGGSLVAFASNSLVAYVGLNRHSLDDVADERSAAAVATHVAASDPHGDRAFAIAADAAHVAAANPHTGYLLGTEVTATPTASKVPRSTSSVYLDNRWIPRSWPRMKLQLNGWGWPSMCDNIQSVPSASWLAFGAAARLCLVPFLVDFDCRIIKISFYNQTASATANARAVIYTASIDDTTVDDIATDPMIVGNLLYDTGNISCAAAAQKITTLGSPISMKKGELYFAGVWCSENLSFYFGQASPLGSPRWRGDNNNSAISRWYSDAFPSAPGNINARVTTTTDGNANLHTRGFAGLQWDYQ